jgi:hypothetical protein
MLFNNLMADDTTDYPRIMGDAGMRLGYISMRCS